MDFSMWLKKWGEIKLKQLPILMGIGIVENQYHEIAYVEVIEPGDFLAADKRLLGKQRESLNAKARS